MDINKFKWLRNVALASIALHSSNSLAYYTYISNITQPDPNVAELEMTYGCYFSGYGYCTVSIDGVTENIPAQPAPPHYNPPSYTLSVTPGTKEFKVCSMGWYDAGRGSMFGCTSSATYTFTVQGNTVITETYQYTYDEIGRLDTVTEIESGKVTDYDYDYADNRTTKVTE